MMVSIVIPIYKEHLLEAEEVSLRQLVKTLPAYNIYFAAPSNLDTSNYLKIAPRASSVLFDPSYFQNIQGYNKLMLSHHFYEKFTRYRYILIYQLDAYIFRDELSAWCLKSYDYIGAPWIEKPPIKKRHTLINLQNLFYQRVGNGGLSLRRVETFYNITKRYSFIVGLFKKNEDMLWGVVIDYIDSSFKKPKWQEALKFAFELNPQKSFELNGNQLPMGVHAWEKYDPNFWKEKMS